jgi:hypothetical protein
VGVLDWNWIGIGLESAVSQKERRTEENLKKYVSEEAEKCGKTWREVNR